MASMTFEEPIDFNEALARREVRAFLPTDMGHEELKSLGSELRERSLLLARVENAEFGNRVLELAKQVAQGKESNDVGRWKLRELLDRMDYKAPQGKEGTIQDLRSDVRLNLILRTQAQMAFGYAQWRIKQSQSYLEEYPAQELFRAFTRKEPRDWPTRWIEAGGELFEGSGGYSQGRMIASVTSPVWEAISAFGLPYAPFDFNSGMDLRPVSRSEAVALGVVEPNQVIHPQLTKPIYLPT